jgi:DUF971 family protein
MEQRANRIRASRAALDREAGQLVITWSDGSASRFGLRQLRRDCPCAGCQELRLHPPAAAPGELVLLDGRAAAASGEAVRLEPVGRYGLRIVWGDGHDHGIYTFANLRQLDPDLTG